MNVYDFDGTIYRGDSTVDFCLYALKKHPLLIRYLPTQAAAVLRYALKRTDKTTMKQSLFRFFAAIDAQGMTEAFWNTHQQHIEAWYLAQQQPEDIIISASPEFLLRPVCQRLGIRHLIASRVSPADGTFRGKNCHGEEKVRRLGQEFPAAHVEQFYSDSLSDLPLAKIADRAFMVKKGVLSAWKEGL